MTIRRSCGGGEVLAEGVVCESQEEQSIDVMLQDEPSETLSGSLRLDIRASDKSNQKMLNGLGKLLKYNKKNDVEHYSPIVDIAFGRRKPYLITNRGRAKLNDDAAIEGSTTTTVPQVMNDLNERQSEAVDMALAIRDIGIIHG